MAPSSRFLFLLAFALPFLLLLLPLGNSSLGIPSTELMLKRLASIFTPSALPSAANMSTSAAAAPQPQAHEINSLPAEWRAELDNLPSLDKTGAIPPLFIAHGRE